MVEASLVVDSMLDVEPTTNSFDDVLANVDDQLLSANDLIKKLDFVILPLLFKEATNTDTVVGVAIFGVRFLTILNLVDMVKVIALSTFKYMPK